MKVFVVGGDTYYANWINDCKLVNNLKEADIVFFTGGEDVSPNLYGCEKHPLTYNNSIRDDYEVKIFNQIRSNQLAVGTCRGNQFLCVMNGGKLVQHCNRHAIYGTHSIINENGTHSIINEKGEEYQITSTHHQMAYPFDLNPEDYEILYWANHIASFYEGDKIDPKKIVKEPEIVYYHLENKPKCLGIQGHPEMMNYERLHDMLNKLILQCIR